MAAHGRMRNAQMSSQGLRDRQHQLDDADRAERPPLPGHRRRPPGLRHWRGPGPDCTELRPPRQPAQQLGLLDGVGLPLSARPAVGEMLIDARGGDLFALPVDAGRQRLPRDIAIHVFIVAHRGRFVPAIVRSRFPGTKPHPDATTSLVDQTQLFGQRERTHVYQHHGTSRTR